NETNIQRIFNAPNDSLFVKDGFDRFIVHGEESAINPKQVGTKAAAYYRLTIPAGGSVTIRFRLFPRDQAPASPIGSEFDQIFATRIAEADDFYDRQISTRL